MDRYQYQSVPQPVHAGTGTARRPLYRQTQQASVPAKPQNIHFDRRVVRGNTYAAAITTLNQLQAQAAANAATRAFSRSSHRPRRMDKKQTPTESQFTSTSIQTDDYLEMLEDAVEGREMGMQTDDYDEEKPLPVMFIPTPAGVNQSTQVEEGELFQFDVAVCPIAEVLLAKAFEVSLREVRQEEELKNLEARIEAFEEERDIMVAQAQKLEQANLRKHEEQQRRLAQERARLEDEKRVQEKLAARRAAKEYMEGLEDRVLAVMEAGGALVDPIQADVEHVFLPWLQQRVCEQLSSVQEVQGCVEDLLYDAIKSVYDERADIHRREQEERERVLQLAREEEAARAEKLRLEEEERQRIIEEAEMMQREEEARLLAAALEGYEGDQAGEGDISVTEDDGEDPMVEGYEDE